MSEQPLFRRFLLEINADVVTTLIALVCGEPGVDLSLRRRSLKHHRAVPNQTYVRPRLREANTTLFF
jgi:hypothetical protein